MEIDSATLAYAPFKNVPAGHVYIVFRSSTGEAISISPEADVEEGDTFSLMRGLRKTYRLRYFVRPAQEIAQKLHADGREVREYPLNLSHEQLRQLYKRMLTRSVFLESTFKWYNTLYNSCITNITRHLRDILGQEISSSIELFVSPERFSRSISA